MDVKNTIKNIMGLKMREPIIINDIRKRNPNIMVHKMAVMNALNKRVKKNDLVNRSGILSNVILWPQVLDTFHSFLC